MPRASVNGIEIEYETFGAPSDRPILLIMGLGAQMTMWDENFCTGLQEAGHFVIRYDARDTGLSTKFDSAGAPDIVAIMTAAAKGMIFVSNRVASSAKASALDICCVWLKIHPCGLFRTIGKAQPDANIVDQGRPRAPIAAVGRKFGPAPESLATSADG